MVEYIGLDIGGTNIRVASIDKNENVIFEYSELTDNNNIISQIIKLIEMVPNYNIVKSIGLSVAGSVDFKTKRVVTSKNIGMLIDYPLAEELGNYFNKQVVIENDAKVSAFLESIKGKGKNKRIVCYITLSTGCGGGIVIDKEIYHGSNSLGAYIARIILDGINTSDNLLSGRALTNMASTKLNKKITVKELFELSQQDIIAKEIVDDFKKYLTALLLNISATFNPDIIILGGGLIKSSDYYLQDVINRFKELVHPLGKKTKIDTTNYKDNNTLGACILAKYSK